MDRDQVLSTAASSDGDVAERLAFIYELDRLKTVLRQSPLADGSRRENSAEHSWHLAMTAMTLAPLADAPINLDRVIKMLLVHDVVEIDAGDVFVYDEARRLEVEAEEQAAADRIFGMLPDGEGAQLRELWDEYEAHDTIDGQFAYACDRLQPALLNMANNGGTWRQHAVTAAQVKTVNGPIGDGLSRVWVVVESLIDAAVDEGLLAAGESTD